MRAFPNHYRLMDWFCLIQAGLIKLLDDLMPYRGLARLFQIAVFLVVIGGFSQNSLAQLNAMQPGEAVITRFGGTIAVIDKNGLTAHRINPNGIVASIVDLRYPGQKPVGQHWANEPQHSAVFANEVGQVFGIALDDASPPNIYLAATSAFGLFRTSDNTGWMKGMWGENGGPGTIYKLNGKENYRPEIFARVRLNHRANAGAGLGNIAYDRVNKQLFVSDLETGMIHRLDITTGDELGIYDHGRDGRVQFFDVERQKPGQLNPVRFSQQARADCESFFNKNAFTPACWRFAAPARRVWGLGVHIDENNKLRLFYAIWDGDDHAGNQVWSIGLGANGRFDLTRVRREFILPLPHNQAKSIAAPVDISFSRFGEMLVGERGEPSALPISPLRPVNALSSARVLQYRLNKHGRWVLSGKYDVGNVDGGNLNGPIVYNNAAGGVSWGYGYDKNGFIDLAKLDGFVWTSGDRLCSPAFPCIVPQSDKTNNSVNVTGIEGRAAYQFDGSVDGSFKIDSDLNVDEAGRQIKNTLTGHDDSRGAGDIEVLVVRQISAEVLSRSVKPKVKAVVVKSAIEKNSKQVRPALKKKISIRTKAGKTKTRRVKYKARKTRRVRTKRKKRMSVRKPALKQRRTKRKRLRKRARRNSRPKVFLYSGSSRPKKVLSKSKTHRVNVFKPSSRAR